MKDNQTQLEEAIRKSALSLHNLTIKEGFLSDKEARNLIAKGVTLISRAFEIYAENEIKKLKSNP